MSAASPESPLQALEPSSASPWGKHRGRPFAIPTWVEPTASSLELAAKPRGAVEAGPLQPMVLVINRGGAGVQDHP